MKRLTKFLFLVLVSVFWANQTSAQAAPKTKFETCLLHHCKNGQMESGELPGAKKLEVRSPKGELLEIISYKIEVIFHDDAISSNVKGASIPEEIAKVIAKLEAGAVIKIRQVKAKEKSGTMITAPDLTLRIF